MTSAGLFDQDKERRLMAELVRLRRNEAILSYYQLQGFLFAISCSPEPIRPSQWFDLIWLNDDPQFDNADAASDFFHTLVGLADYIAASVRQRRYLPFENHYHHDLQQPLAEWCEGLLIGHHYLEDVWSLALDDLDDDDLTEAVNRALALAGTFADLNDEIQLALEDDLLLSHEHLSESFRQLWRALAAYAGIGPQWAQGAWEFDIDQLFLALDSVPRNEPCPCGSGRTFGRCCLH